MAANFASSSSSELSCFRFFFGGDTTSESSPKSPPGVELDGVSDFTFDSDLGSFLTFELELLFVLEYPFVCGVEEVVEDEVAAGRVGGLLWARSNRSIIRSFTAFCRYSY